MLVLVFGILITVSCTNRSAVDETQLVAIYDLVVGNKNPDEVALDTEEIMRHSAAYAKILAGHMGLPKDSDLHFILGQEYYLWGDIDKALLYLQQADRGRRSLHGDVATDYLLYSAALAGRYGVIEGLRPNANWMLSKGTFLELAGGDCGTLEMALRDMAVSSKGEKYYRILAYIEFLSRWTDKSCWESRGYFESELLSTALAIITLGADWEDFIEELKREEIKAVQQVMLPSFLSICDSAIAFADEIGDEELKNRWDSYFQEMRDILYDRERSTFKQLDFRSY